VITPAPKAKLVEIAELNPRLPETPDSDELVSFVPMSAVTAESASTTRGEDRFYGEVSSGYTPFLNGDVLLAKITPCFENGKIAQATLSHRIGVGSTEFHVVRPLAGKADARYLLHFLRQERIRRDGERRMTGSAGQRRVPEHFLAGLEVPAPPVEEQRRIAEVLDRAEALRAKRRAALSQLETLPQSIFLDLFGDPATNPKEWQRTKLGDAVLSASDGPHVSPTYSDDGIPFISTRHVREGEITWEDLKFISREDAEIHWRKCKPELGDVLYTKGGTTGLAVAVETNKPFALWVHVALLKPNLTKVDSIWLESMLNTRFCYRQSQELTHGIANRDLGLTRMVKIDMFLPPLTLQREFARRIASLKKIRTGYRASLVQMDALFASFQHRAFRGEL
jgi:type I restriction enzyme, S subunit